MKFRGSCNTNPCLEIRDKLFMKKLRALFAAISLKITNNFQKCQRQMVLLVWDLT
jgi:hypothetical protein